MKNYLCLYLLASVFLFGCNSSEPDFLSPESNSDEYETASLRTSGDGIYDLLGFGYDCTWAKFKGGDYAKAPVIDIKAFLADPTNSIIEHALHNSSDEEIVFGSDLKEYQNAMTRSANIKASPEGVPLFSAELSFEARQYNRNSSCYSYMRITQLKRTRKIKMSQVNPVFLKKYLSAGFKSDLKYSSGAEIVAKYGTHVITDELLGGSASVLFTARAESTSDSSFFKADGKLAYGALASLGASGSSQKYEFKNHKDIKISMKTSGGKVSILEDIKYDPSTGTLGNMSVNFSSWANSVDRTCEQIIGIGDNTTTIYPIIDFIDDVSKRAEVEQALKVYVQTQLLPMSDYQPLDYWPHQISSLPFMGGTNPSRPVLMAEYLHVNKNSLSNKVYYFLIPNYSSQYHIIKVDNIDSNKSSAWWTFYPEKEYYRITTLDRECYLTLGNVDNSFATVTPFNSNDRYQLWDVQNRGDYYTIRNVETNFYLNNSGRMIPWNPYDKSLKWDFWAKSKGSPARSRG